MLHEKLAAIVSGGSFVSTSCRAVAAIVVEQVSPSTNAASGSSVNVTGPLPATTVAVCAPDDVHWMPNQPGSTVTGSEKVIVRFVLGSTPDAPAAGTVEATLGAASPALVRGFGAPVAKSWALSSVSVALL